MKTGKAPASSVLRKCPLDQVSRIMHAQHAMKHFLGGLGKPAMPEWAAPETAHASVLPQTPIAMKKEAASSTISTIPYTSFQKKISDENTNMICTICDHVGNSSAMQYIYMPTLAKPWIPVCAACRKDATRT